MGHLHLGQLPRTVSWRTFLALIDEAPEQTQRLGASVVNASDARLARLGNDAAVSYCFWLLVRITTASRMPGFFDALNQLGITATADTTALGLVALIAERAQSATMSLAVPGHFGELATLALTSALTETVGQQAPSLFGRSADDLQAAVRAHATEQRFGALAQRFFAAFMARTLGSLVDRELANHIGGTHRIGSIAESSEVLSALETHTRESAGVIHDFAGEWWSKYQYLSEGAITPDTVQRFVGHALAKLRYELKREAAPA